MISKRKILVVQIGKLGDMVLTTPLFYELNKHFPEDELYALASNINYEIPEKIKFIKKTFVFKKNIFSLITLLIQLRNLKFDLIIDTKTEYSKTGELLVNFLKPKNSIGFNSTKKVFNLDLNGIKKGNHFIEYSLTPMYYLKSDFIPEFTKPILNFKRGEKTEYDISLNISSGYEIRNWKTEFWIEVIKYCLKFNYKINVIYDKNHIDKINHLKHSFNNKIHYTKTDLDSKISSIAESKLIISTDTSIIHIAAAFNKPVIALYTNVKWNLDRFYPKSEKSIILISDSEESVNSITFKEVTDSIDRFRKEGIF
ncbi:MAG TPA: glycosyltransferase family 9 protein [Ignavibacteria bacterium]|nr:glycosyltransferase family 9 protein [Ignavibacteria bacterium]